MKQDQDKYLKILKDLTNAVIQERKKEFGTIKQMEMETGEKSEKRSIFIDKLLQAKNEDSGFTDEDIMDEVMTMMFAVSIYYIRKLYFANNFQNILLTLINIICV